MSKKYKPPSKIPKIESLKQINLNACGIDIGTEEIFVCVPEDRATPNVRKFQNFTRDLNQIANWLIQCQVETVAMESTGIYWIPLYEVLTKKWVAVNLVNAREVKTSQAENRYARLSMVTATPHLRSTESIF